jgi:outer membrane protein assembly factor BamE (lipoprotein component of BamABCDE complex)
MNSVKKRHRFILTVSSLALIGLGISACTPTQKVRGNLVQDYQLETIKIGEDTEREILRKLGSPTTKAPFDDNVWYYIGQEKEKRGVLDSEVINERIIVASFDDEGTLISLEDLDNQRMDLPLVSRKTETSGNEVTAMQQILGNLGRFNAPKTND